MASYNELNALIDAYINRNGVQAITGQILNGVLKAMVEQLGRGYTIMGAAIPTTDPGTPDGPECYFASETGTYTDFDGLQVAPGELALLCYTPSDGWTKATIYEGFQEVGATIDGNVGTPSVGVSYAGGVLSFDFHNMKGNPGQNGQDGAAAGFGTIGADITGGVGTPGVSVESSGPATAKNLQFHFTNLKGETGVTSVVATVDNTTGTPACTVSLVGQQLTLAFSGLKGAQGDTGSSVDYPFTIVNNLTTDDATQALSAAQGVVLEGEITQLEAEVDVLDSATGIIWNDILNSYDVLQYRFTQGVWDAYGELTQTRYKAVKKGDVIHLKASANGTTYAFLNSIPDTIVEGTTPVDYVSGTGNNSATANQEVFAIAPADCYFAYFAVTKSGAGRIPSYVYQSSNLSNLVLQDGKKIDDLYANLRGLSYTGTTTSNYQWIATGISILPGNKLVNDGEIDLRVYDADGTDHIINAGVSVVTDYEVVSIRGIASTGKYSLRIVGVENQIEEIEASTEVRDSVSPNYRRTGVEFSSSWSLSQNENTDIVEYPEFKVGTRLRIVVKNINTSVLVRAYSTLVLQSGAQFKNIPGNSDIPIYYTIEEGYPFIRICCDTGTTPVVQEVESVTDLAKRNSVISARCDSTLGSNAGTESVANMTDGDTLTLSKFPYHCRKGLAMSFYADIAVFGKIMVGKGYQKYRGRWIEIDSTNLVFKGSESNGAEYTIATIPHGLSIGTFIKVVISCNYSAKWQVVIMTLGGQFKYVQQNNYEGNYAAFAKSSGSTLTNCKLNATSTDFKLPVWMFGASYLGVAENRFPGQLKEIGYFNYMIDNLAGMGSEAGYNDLLRCLEFGTPKFLLWAFGFNDYADQATAIAYAEKVKELCAKKGIELLFFVYASVPYRNMTQYQTWLRSEDCGCRLIDFDKAVGSPVYEEGVDNWYPGYLSSDDVHPTQLGAKAMATQVLIDFPEMMQYGLYSDDTTLDDSSTDQ